MSFICKRDSKKYCMACQHYEDCDRANRCINRTNGQEDEDIRNLIAYVFRQILDCNTNLLLLCCISKTKETIMPEITQILKEDTNYYKDMEYREAIRQ